jgi:hypothetical protein
MTEKLFTSDEQRVLEIYRNPKLSGFGRAARLSGQYLLGAGIFTYAAVAYQSWYAVVTYLVFVIYVTIRLLAARRLVDVMPKILAKYETRIAELEARVESPVRCDHDSEDVANESNS